MKLSIHLLHFPVRTLGPGVRVGLWVQGCSLHCPHCLTPESWPFLPEQGIPVEELAETLAYFFAPDGGERAEGVTLSGGEPFDQPEALFELLKYLNRKGIRDILLYSGYTRERLLGQYPDLPNWAASLVDGQFNQQSPTSATWKGSENQTLTLWRSEFEEQYRLWTEIRARKLQLVQTNERRFLVGIPDLRDSSKLKTLS